MNNNTQKVEKKVFRPVTIQLIKYNFDDLISTSSGYNPFFGEEDPLSPPESEESLPAWNEEKQ